MLETLRHSQSPASAALARSKNAPGIFDTSAILVAMEMQTVVSERSEGWFSSGDCGAQGSNETLINSEYVG